MGADPRSQIRLSSLHAHPLGHDRLPGMCRLSSWDRNRARDDLPGSCAARSLAAVLGVRPRAREGWLLVPAVKRLVRGGGYLALDSESGDRCLFRMV